MPEENGTLTRRLFPRSHANTMLASRNVAKFGRRRRKWIVNLYLSHYVDRRLIVSFPVGPHQKCITETGYQAPAHCKPRAKKRPVKHVHWADEQ